MGRIKALDGWRGISILFVLASHFALWRYSGLPLRDTTNWPAVYLAHLGVSIFFCISGYLIHGLALQELDRTGAFASLKFYGRRFFRIVPAFAVYVGAVGVLAACGVYAMAPEKALPALAFACNLVVCPDLLNHTWSLAVEEQFYLLFPLALLLRSDRRIGLFVGFFVLLAGLLLWNFRVHTALSHAMLGHMKPFAFIVSGMFWAEVRATPSLRIPEHTASRIVLLYFAALAATVLVQGRLAPGGAAAYAMVVWDLLLLPIVCGFALMASEQLASGVLTSPPLVFAGKISFSLYLWQQLYAAHPDLLAVNTPLLSPLLLLPVAVGSYYLVERPAIRAGQRLVARDHGAVAPRRQFANRSP